MAKQLSNRECHEAHDERMAHLADCLDALSTDGTEYLYISGDEGDAVIQQYSPGGFASLEELDEDKALEMLQHFIDVSIGNVKYLLDEGFYLTDDFQERLEFLLERIWDTEDKAQPEEVC